MSASEASANGPERRVPGATYRLQLNRDFRFSDVQRIVPYLRRLGVTHCYLSPYLKARPGSTHGYDVIDHASLNDEIGSRQELEALSQALREASMGQIADIVPNHMGVMGSDSAWWLDVLENGQASPYAGYFDIDWHPVRPELRDKVLVPILGDHYGTVLERGELRLTFAADEGAFAVHYYEHTLPIDPGSYGEILGIDIDDLARRIGSESPDYAEYLSILRAIEQLPSHADTDEEHMVERRREKEVIKRRLATLCQHRPSILEHVERVLATVAGSAERPESFSRLHDLLERQAWRVAYWQVAADEINYRRFFDINELAALRMDQPELLRATHGLVAELYRSGHIDGLRIDHPDGLYDPATYFESLQRLLVEGSDTSASTAPHCYIVAEKILATHEHLREDWAVHGTTGYEFAALVDGLGINPDSARVLERSYRTFTHERAGFDALLYSCKKLIIRVHLSSELTMLANLLHRIALGDWHTRDFTLNGLRHALTEIVAAFPVYRTYVTPMSVTAEDRQYVEWAVAWARKRDPETIGDIYDFVERLLLLELPPDLSHRQRSLCVRFAMNFQQYTAPVMAKALEDTSFYRYVKLASLCEVGGDPNRYGVSIAAFHHHNRARQRRWPHSMLAGSTHDSKRSQDVRARLNVISELPDEWRQRVRRWRQLTRAWRKRLEESEAPSRADEYLFYQSLCGIWPIDSPDESALAALTERLTAYMRKAAREAKLYTSWMRPNAAYEGALEGYIRACMKPGGDNLFLADVSDFAQRLGHYGLLNSLSITALRLTAPGVPDTYQGDELWSFNLVDPDNRRPVDYERRSELLTALASGLHEPGDASQLVDELMGSLHDGRAKLYMTWRLLNLRQQLRDVFDHGEYMPLGTDGAMSEHVCAFARRHDEDIVLVLAGRWFALLEQQRGLSAAPLRAEHWADTRVELPDATSTLRDELTGRTFDASMQRLHVADLLAPLPAAVLTGHVSF